MLQRLNYYSRYNRIKSPKQIQTLYHLLDDLNIDAIVTDDLIQKVSALRETHIIEREQYRRNNIFKSNIQQIYIRDGVNQENSSNKERRFVSCDSSQGGRRREQNDRIQISFGNLDQIHLKIKTSRDSEKAPSVSIPAQNKTDRSSKRENSSQKNGHSSIGHSKPRTGNLSEMNCLQTQSIPDSFKQHQEEQVQSPIFKLGLQYKQQNEQSNHSAHQDSGIKILEQESQQNEQSSTKQVQIEMISGSKFNDTNQKQREGGILTSNFGDQVSDGIAELHRVDQLRKSTFSKVRDNQNTEDLIKDCRSEQLDRLYGSDIEMEIREDQIREFQHKHHNIEQQSTQILGPARTLQEAHKYFKQYHNQDQEDAEDYQQEENDYQNETQQQKQRYMKQLTSIDNRIQHKNQEQLKQPAALKIPSNALTSGKWPIGATQKSIEGVIQFSQHGEPASSREIVKNSGVVEKQRKPFKKMIMDRKLNPRMVTSTIVTDAPIKKVNFKKVIKKQSMENKQKQATPQSKKIKQIKPNQEKKQLLKAFFDQN